MAFALPRILPVALLWSLAVAPAAVLAQGADEPTLYVAVDCMKSASPDYESVETEIWQPMHQEQVRRGLKNGWQLYFVLYGDRSECDYYTVNSYLGEDQLNDTTPFNTIFEAVHPGQDWDEIAARTLASRAIVRTELWTFVDGVLPEDFQYAAVNYMWTSDDVAYVDMEIEMYKPVHEALVRAGHRAGWGMYQLLQPHGTSVPYNYGTVDFMNRLGSVPWLQTMRQVHPGVEASAVNQRMEGIRDLVRGELWVRLAGTTP